MEHWTSYVYWSISVLAILSVLIPAIKNTYWTFRVFDYPRFQKFIILLVLILVWFFTFENPTIYDQVLLFSEIILSFYLFYKKEDIGDEKLSDNVYEQILMKKTIKSGTVTSNIDKWIIILAFIYDLNFEYSLKKIRDEKYIEKLIDRIDYKDEQTKKRMEYLKITAIEDINKKINKEEQK